MKSGAVVSVKNPPLGNPAFISISVLSTYYFRGNRCTRIARRKSPQIRACEERRMRVFKNIDRHIMDGMRVLHRPFLFLFFFLFVEVLTCCRPGSFSFTQRYVVNLALTRFDTFLISVRKRTILTMNLSQMAENYSSIIHTDV